MKKVFITMLIAFAGFSMNAQQFNAGISAGIPTGDAGDFYTFSLFVDANYLWELSEGLNVGAATGYISGFGDSVDRGILGSFDVEDAGFIPLAAAGRYNISEKFTVGADLGYAIAIAPDDADGGFYYAPRAQYHISELMSVVLAYRGISQDGTSFDNVTVGLEFKL